MTNFKVSLDDMRKTRRLVESIVNFKNNLLSNNLKIQLSRNSLRGNNPSYTITIHGDGRIIYEGLKNVRILGSQNSYITRDKLIELLNEIQNVYFFSLKDVYGNTGNDGTLGTITTTITLGNDAKKVVRYENYEGPAGLIELEDSIDRIVNSQQWTGTGNKQ